MPRNKSPVRDIARDMWEAAGGKIKMDAIARAVGKSEGQIRRWKCEDKWEKREPGESTGGAPVGNQNAKGHGAPFGNTNAVTTGLTETLSKCDVTIQEMAEQAEREKNYKAMILIDQLRENAIRLCRMRRKRDELLDGKEMLVRFTSMNSVPSSHTRADSGMKVTGVNTSSESKFDRVLRLEEAITKIQDNDRRAIDQLHRMGIDDRTLEWKKELAQEGGSAAIPVEAGGTTKVIFYLPDDGREVRE